MTISPFQLGDIAPPSWFQDKANSNFLLRVYSSFGFTHDEFKEVVLPKSAVIRIRNDVRLVFVLIDQLKMMTCQLEAYSNEQGTCIISTELGERQFPKSTYVFLASPMRIDGVDEHEPTVRNRLDEVAGLVKACCGINMMREVVYEVIVKADSSGIVGFSPVFEKVMPCDGPFVEDSSFVEINEVSIRLQNLRSYKRQRVDLALQYFNRALERDDVFFNYWTALEILCDGKSGRIKKKVSDCYATHKLHNDEANRAIRQITDLRNAFIHKGVRPHLSTDAERYIQMLFLDLLRQEIDLKFVNHLGVFRSKGGYDLKCLGLSSS